MQQDWIESDAFLSYLHRVCQCQVYERTCCKQKINEPLSSQYSATFLACLICARRAVGQVYPFILINYWSGYRPYTPSRVMCTDKLIGRRNFLGCRFWSVYVQRSSFAFYHFKWVLMTSISYLGKFTHAERGGGQGEAEIVQNGKRIRALVYLRSGRILEFDDHLHQQIT